MKISKRISKGEQGSYFKGVSRWMKRNAIMLQSIGATTLLMWPIVTSIFVAESVQHKWLGGGIIYFVIVIMLWFFVSITVEEIKERKRSKQREEDRLRHSQWLFEESLRRLDKKLNK